MRKVVIGTGWYADEKGHNNKNVALYVQNSTFFREMWIPHIRKQLKEQLGAIVIYQSDCTRKIFSTGDKDVILIQGLRAPDQHHHNDSGATQMSGAMYALCNEMDYVFVEQDCFILGFSGALSWARQNFVSVAFSMHNYSQDLSRGEHCFMYVSYEYLKTYITKLMNANWHKWDEGRGFPELHVVDMFGNDAARWPFGYGRKRPINWNDHILYLQQPTEDDLKHVEEQLSKRF